MYSTLNYPQHWIIWLIGILDAVCNCLSKKGKDNMITYKNRIQTMLLDPLIDLESSEGIPLTKNKIVWLYWFKVSTEEG